MIPSFYKKWYITSFSWKNNDTIIFTPEDPNQEIIQMKKEEYLKEWFQKTKEVRESNDNEL